MTEKLTVEFEVHDRAEFERALEIWHNSVPNGAGPGYRIDKGLEQREALRRFSSDMEQKLRKNDWKTDWRSLPLIALFRKLLIEIEEFKVSFDYYPVGEAKRELVDIANFALIVYDRMSRLHQDKPASAQGEETYGNIGQSFSPGT